MFVLLSVARAGTGSGRVERDDTRNSPHPLHVLGESCSLTCGAWAGRSGRKRPRCGPACRCRGSLVPSRLARRAGSVNTSQTVQALGRGVIRTKWLIAACSAGAFASVAPVADAAELAARGPAECPDAEELSFRVERHIGVELDAAAPLRFDVTFERAGAGYSAQIDVSAQAADAAPQRR